MNVLSDFYAYICMLNIFLMLVNFGNENWSRIPDFCSGFYTLSMDVLDSAVRCAPSNFLNRVVITVPFLIYCQTLFRVLSAGVLCTLRVAE